MNEHKEKFTPGPWRVLGRGVYKGDEDAKIVADTFYADANAALIAAAPEMYEELEKTASFLRFVAKWIEKTHGVIAIGETMKYRAETIDKLLDEARGEAINGK